MLLSPRITQEHISHGQILENYLSGDIDAIIDIKAEKILMKDYNSFPKEHKQINVKKRGETGIWKGIGENSAFPITSVKCIYMQVTELFLLFIVLIASDSLGLGKSREKEYKCRINQTN